MYTIHFSTTELQKLEHSIKNRMCFGFPFIDEPSSGWTDELMPLGLSVVRGHLTFVNFVLAGPSNLSFISSRTGGKLDGWRSS